VTDQEMRKFIASAKGILEIFPDLTVYIEPGRYVKLSEVVQKYEEYLEIKRMLS